LGYRPNSTKGKNFYRLPFTPPPPLWSPESVLQKARAEKTAHIQEHPIEQQTHENDDDEEETIDKELERVQQKI
jgi:hypothetical protein